MVNLKEWKLYVTSLFLMGVVYMALSVQPIKKIPKATTRSEYITNIAQDDNKLQKIISKGEFGLEQYIAQILSAVEHVTPEHNYTDIKVFERPTVKELSKLTEKELISTYYLLHALSTNRFREKIGKELYLDMKDRKGEHGGVLRLQEQKNLEIDMLRDISKDSNVEIINDFFTSDPDKTYCPETPAYTLDILTMFHFHAQQYNNGACAMLSGNDMFAGGGALFTLVDTNKFNVDFGFAYRNDSLWKSVILDLGVYEF